MKPRAVRASRRSIRNNATRAGGEVTAPRLRPAGLMPALPKNGLTALSLFSGGGGLDLGFERAGFEHAGSWDVLQAAADTIAQNRPAWGVHGGPTGDVSNVRWSTWRGCVDVVHGGPPCQPFSVAGKRRGAKDERDMIPAFVRAVRAMRPAAFLFENVAALGGPSFRSYLETALFEPLGRYYFIHALSLSAEWFGVPQRRRRLLLVGFRRRRDDNRWMPPHATHASVVTEAPSGGVRVCRGARWALGLPDIGYDAVTPTIRSSLTGPHHTTSVLSSQSAGLAWGRLRIWPNGVAPTRSDAASFAAPDGQYRLSVADVALLQGFPKDWVFTGAVYMALGQVGNAVPPPVAYAAASAMAAAILGSQCDDRETRS